MSRTVRWRRFWGSIRSILLDGGLLVERDLVGLDDEKIRTIEAAAGVPLPAAYVAFLRVCGARAGGFQRSTDMFGEVIPQLRILALRILAQEPAPIALPDTMLVFAAHGGYQFWAMDTVDGDPSDPPVHFFVMESAGLERCDERFTDYIAGAVQAELAIGEHLKRP